MAEPMAPRAPVRRTRQFEREVDMVRGVEGSVGWVGGVAGAARDVPKSRRHEVGLAPKPILVLILRASLSLQGYFVGVDPRCFRYNFASSR